MIAFQSAVSHGVGEAASRSHRYPRMRPLQIVLSVSVTSGCRPEAKVSSWRAVDDGGPALTVLLKPKRCLKGRGTSPDQQLAGL